MANAVNAAPNQLINMKKCNLPKLDLAVSTDDLRPRLQHIMFDGVCAWASDAHSFCRWQLQDMINPELSQGKFMHGRQWKTLRSLPGPYEICEIGIWCYDKQVLVAWSEIDGEYPNIKAAVSGNSVSMDYACVVPRYLNKCGQVFGTSDLNWQIGYTGKLITIMPSFSVSEPGWLFACVKIATSSHLEFAWWDQNYIVTNFKP
jgi:hypothetical protein